MQCSRVLADGQVAKKLLELASARHVVVVLQHRQQQTLAKAPRAQEEQLFADLLEDTNVVAAIDEVVALADDLSKVADAVGELHRLPLLPACQ